MHILRFRSLALAVILALVLAACGGDDSSDGSVDLNGAADSDDTDASADTPDPSGGVDPTIEASTPDPILVGQLGSILVQGQLADDANTCLVAASESDDSFAAAVNVTVAGQRLLEDDEFASIATNVRDCAGADVMLDGIARSVALGEDTPELRSCLGDSVETAGDDNLIVGLSALSVGVPIPASSELVTLDALAECVTDDIIAGQLADDYEAQTGYVQVVDRDCVTGALADLDLSVYWDAQILNDVDGLEPINAALEACAADPYEGLATAVPDDFEPWAGDRALAEVVPPARIGAYSEAPPMIIDPDIDYSAIITTDDGQIVLDLFEDDAPLTVNNFVALARDGYYDGIVFHRVLADFMAQGGDPSGTGTGGPGYQFADEFDSGREFEDRGVLAMANSGPATNGGQFFITFLPTPHLNGLHTIFGQVVDGDVVLGSIDFRDPAAPVGRGEVIESIEIVEG